MEWLVSNAITFRNPLQANFTEICPCGDSTPVGGVCRLLKLYPFFTLEENQHTNEDHPQKTQ